MYIGNVGVYLNEDKISLYIPATEDGIDFTEKLLKGLKFVFSQITSIEEEFDIRVQVFESQKGTRYSIYFVGEESLYLYGGKSQKDTYWFSLRHGKDFLPLELVFLLPVEPEGHVVSKMFGDDIEVSWLKDAETEGGVSYTVVSIKKQDITTQYKIATDIVESIMPMMAYFLLQSQEMQEELIAEGMEG